MANLIPSGINTNANSLTDFVKNPFTRKPGSIKEPDFKSGFVIEEMTLDGVSPASLPGGKGVRITLMGNQMPQIPFTFGGEQKIVKDYYPGNPEAVAHVLGAREDDVTIKGRFYAKKYPGNTVPLIPKPADLFSQATANVDAYGIPDALRDAIDKMRIRGNPVRIALGAWVRYGFITNTKWEMKTLGDIAYEITFTIVSFSKPTRTPILKGNNAFPIESQSALLDQAAKLAEDAQARQIPTAVPTSISELINEAIGAVAAAVATVTDFIEGVIETGENITNSINRAVGIVKNAEATVNRYKTRLGAISYNLSFAGIPVPDRYQASNIISSNMGSFNDFSKLLAELRRKFQALAQTIPLSRYKTMDGDTLQKIAIRFYKNADLWKKIYDHNKLTSTALDSGVILEIPKL